MKASKAIYALVLFLFAATSCKAEELKPVDHQPIKVLVEALKSSDHKRIAQGLHIGLARDVDTQKLFVPRMPLMLTKKGDTDEWTVSIFHDKLTGSTLLIGDKLQEIDTPIPERMQSFDREAEKSFAARNPELYAMFYPDEVKRLVDDFGYRRVYTGSIGQTTLSKYKDAKPVFFDLLVTPEGNRFSVLIVNEQGVCFKVLGGYSFAENN